MDANVYYNPEHFGLTTIGTIDFSDGGYVFDITAVWADANGRLYYASDSGCSCPSPFENTTLDKLTACTPGTLQAHLERSAADADERQEERIAAAIVELMGRIHALPRPTVKIEVVEEVVEQETADTVIDPLEYASEFTFKGPGVTVTVSPIPDTDQWLILRRDERYGPMAFVADGGWDTREWVTISLVASLDPITVSRVGFDRDRAIAIAHRYAFSPTSR